MWVPMGAIILTHISTSSNDLLFMHMKSGLFEDFLVLKKLARLQVSDVLVMSCV